MKNNEKQVLKKKTIHKAVDIWEKRAETRRNNFKLEDLSSEEGKDTFCVLCCERCASNEQCAQCIECTP